MFLLNLVTWLSVTTLVYQATEPVPETISPLTLLAEQNQIENPKSVLRGDVESVLWEQVRMEDKEFRLQSKLTRYDRDGRVVEESDPTRPGWRTIRFYENGRLMWTRARRVADAKSTNDDLVQTWKYDAAGRVLEFKRVRGQKMENHLVSTYDASGRIIRSEVRQGEVDALVFTNIYRYTGNPALIERRTVSQSGGSRDPIKMQLDSGGNVVELWDEGGMHVHWKFDKLGRVTEQVTDAYTVPSGCDACPLPGKIQAVYRAASPEETVREQTFLDENGTVVLRRITRFERDGSIASIRFEILSAAPSMLTRVVTAIRPNGGERYVETTWDEQGNWTEKRDFFQPAAGGSPRVLFVYRRRIMYR